MKFIRLILELIALYLLYKFVFDLLLPLIRSTKKMKQQVDDFNTRQQPTSTPKSTGSRSENDYIDYEEIR
jgi:hypothetical protein